MISKLFFKHFFFVFPLLQLLPLWLSHISCSTFNVSHYINSFVSLVVSLSLLHRSFVGSQKSTGVTEKLLLFLILPQTFKIYGVNYILLFSAWEYIYIYIGREEIKQFWITTATTTTTTTTTTSIATSSFELLPLLPVLLLLLLLLLTTTTTTNTITTTITTTNYYYYYYFQATFLSLGLLSD